MKRISRNHKTNQERGLSIVELAVAVTLFALIAAGVGFMMTRGMEQRRFTYESYLALNSVRNLLANMQETANEPQDLTAQKGIGALYMKYNGRTTTIPDVESGSITVTCHANETSVPTELGGPRDLNFDGDANDNLANASNGTDLKLVPVAINVSIGSGDQARSEVYYRFIAQTAD